MSDYKCKNCDNTKIVMKQKPPHVGIYCAKCDTWIKWANKEERIAYENRLTIDQLEAPCQMKPDKTKSKLIYIDDMPELKEPSPYDCDYFEDDDLPWE